MADRRITKRVGVVGLGYVGLPLAAAFAEAGLTVTGVDTDPEKISDLGIGDSYVEDVSSECLRPLISSGRLHPTGDYGALKEADAVIICLPTPLKVDESTNLPQRAACAHAPGPRTTAV